MTASDAPQPDHDHAARVAAREAADERATVLLKRVGVVLLVLLAVWIAIVLYGFMG